MAIFDPAQGFWNFVLFVMTSEDERGKMWGHLRDGSKYVHTNVLKYIPGYILLYNCLCGSSSASGGKHSDSNSSSNTDSGSGSGSGSSAKHDQHSSTVSTQVWGGDDAAMATSQQNQFIVHSANINIIHNSNGTGNGNGMSSGVPVSNTNTNTSSELGSSLLNPLL